MRTISSILPLLFPSACSMQLVDTDKTLVSWVIRNDKLTDGGSDCVENEFNIKKIIP